MGQGGQAQALAHTHRVSVADGSLPEPEHAEVWVALVPADLGQVWWG